MMAVISGVAGMTGSQVAARLLDRNMKVIGFDNFFAGARRIVDVLRKRVGFTFFEYDINDTAMMDDLFGGLRNHDEALVFINCAAVVHTKHFYRPDDTFLTNVCAMHDTLDRAIRSHFSKYINCSTSEVYSMKSWVKGGVREDAPVLMATAEQSLRTSYATGKLLTEFFIRDAVERSLIQGCSIRFANVYSPEEEYAEHVIPYTISSLASKKKVILLENAKKTYRTFLHNNDSCASVISLLDTPIALDGSVYNVGTNEEVSILDLVSIIADTLKVEGYSVEFYGKRSADPTRRLLCVEKITKATGWTPAVSLRTGIEQCVEAYKKRETAECIAR